MKLIKESFDSKLPFVKFSTEVREGGVEPSFEIVAFNIAPDEEEDVQAYTKDELVERLKKEFPEGDLIKDNPYSGHILRTPHCYYEATLVSDLSIGSDSIQVAWNSHIGANTPIQIVGPKHPRDIDPKTVITASFEDAVTLSTEQVGNVTICAIESMNPHIGFTCKLRSILVGDKLDGEFFEQIRGNVMALVMLDGVMQFMDVETDSEGELRFLLDQLLVSEDGETNLKIFALGTQFHADVVSDEDQSRMVIYVEHEPDNHWGTVLRKPIMEAYMKGDSDGRVKPERVNMLVGDVNERLELFSEQLEAMIEHGLANM